MMTTWLLCLKAKTAQFLFSALISSSVENIHVSNKGVSTYGLTEAAGEGKNHLEQY